MLISLVDGQNLTLIRLVNVQNWCDALHLDDPSINI